MDIILQEYLPRVIIAIPVGIGFIVFFVLCIRRFHDFPFIGYQYSSKDRFKNILLSSVYLSASMTCLLILISLFLTQPFDLGIIPAVLMTGLMMGICAIPIGILAAFGGYIKMNVQGLIPRHVRRGYIYKQPKLYEYPRIKEEVIELSGRAKITAALAAILASIAIYFI